MNVESNNKILIIVRILVLLLLGVGLFLFLGTDLFKSKNGFEGIFESENDKMYIRKTSDNEFHYMIGGNFEGTAIIDGNNAKEKSLFDDVNDGYFEFRLVNDGVELKYVAPNDEEVATDTGIYKRVAEYSKDNVYKEAVGDPKYLKTKYNGVFKNNDIELIIY